MSPCMLPSTIGTVIMRIDPNLQPYTYSDIVYWQNVHIYFVLNGKQFRMVLQFRGIAKERGVGGNPASRGETKLGEIGHKTVKIGKNWEEKSGKLKETLGSLPLRTASAGYAPVFHASHRYAHRFLKKYS